VRLVQRITEDGSDGLPICHILHGVSTWAYPAALDQLGRRLAGQTLTALCSHWPGPRRRLCRWPCPGTNPGIAAM
jgi:hypothetical protein